MGILIFIYIWFYMHAITFLMSASSTSHLCCLSLALYVHSTLSVPHIWQNSSFLVLVTVHTEFDRNVSGCVHSVCKGCLPTWYLMKLDSEQLIWWRELMLIPVLGSWYFLGAMWGKTTVDACHIKVCILSGDLHIFVCMFFMLVKDFSHLNVVLSGYPDQRRPIWKCIRIFLIFNPSVCWPLCTVQCFKSPTCYQHLSTVLRECIVG